jgi:hypothetical protein
MNIPYHLILTALLVAATGVTAPAQDTLRFSRKDSLQQVTVTAAKNLLQIENGRIVMNTANSALTTGASVFDLLKKMPGVSVSQDDAISLRGTEGVNVMIDGKMNYLSGKQLADFLKGLGTENVIRIELITTPTAEFDAAGNAGIINIVTRKGTTRGYAVDVKSTVTRGYTWMFNENVTASLNNKKISLYTSVDYNTPNRQLQSNSGNTIQEHNNTYRLERNNTGLYKIKFYTLRLGGDWRLNNSHQFSINYHHYFDDFTVYKEATVLRYDNDNQVSANIKTHNTIIEPYHYDAGNFVWAWNINTTGKKLTTEAHYISYRNLSDALMNSFTTSVAVTDTNALRSHQPGYITIRSVKADLEWPYNGFLFKTGVKFASVSNDNNYRFDSLVAGSFTEAGSMSNHFIYNEKVSAAYLSVAKKINNTSLMAGLRVEHTNANGYTVKHEFTNRWTYTSFFPNFSVDQAIGKHKLIFSVSRRINRPTYADLNPVRWYTDQYFYYSGNLSLVPEMAWLLSTAFTLQSKYIVTATYGIRENYMTKQLAIDSATGAVKSQTANFSNMQRFDLLFSAPVSAGRWSMQASAVLNYSRYPVTETMSHYVIMSRWAANVRTQHQLQLPAGFKVEAAMYYYTPELWGIYLKQHLFFADIGVRKSFINEKLLVQASLNDCFGTYRLRAGSLSAATDYRYNDRPDIQRIGLSVRYHIGGKLMSKKTSNIEEQERL